MSRLCSRRPHLLAVVIAIATALAPCLAAEASLERYRLRRTLASSSFGLPSPDLSPNCRNGNADQPVVSTRIDACSGLAVLDGSAPAPVLRQFLFAEDWTVTIMVTPLAAPIFLSTNARTATQAPATGAGDSGAGGSIRWGVVTGWTISGSYWCESTPSIVCAIAMGSDAATTEPPWTSDYFDLGTWVFHGTGFTASPFIHRYFTSVGNAMTLYSGFRVSGSTVPALPVLATVALGGVLAVGAVVALRTPGRRAE